jgi:hypothetical protein
MKTSRSHRIVPRAAMAVPLVIPLALLAACGTAARPAAQTGPATAAATPQAGAPQDAGSADAASSSPTAEPGSPVGSGSPSPSAPPPPPPAGTRVPGAAGCPMFPASNVWNTDISKLPVNSRSAAWMRSMNSAHTLLHPDFGPNQGGYPYGITFNVVTTRHPKIAVKFHYASDSNKGPYPFGPDIRIEGGQNAGGDRHAIMVNRGTCTLYELFDARYSARGSTAGSGAIWNLRSNALRPAGFTSADAAGLPILPGLLNYSEVVAAARTGRPIRHAIRFTADTTQEAFLWPARHEAGSTSSANVPPMGARFRLKASFSVATYCRDATPYCRDAKAVLTEMQHYGLILADNGSNWFFGGSAFPQWPDDLVSLLKGIPASAFQAVSESCLMVHRNSGQATAKPGCPVG